MARNYSNTAPPVSNGVLLTTTGTTITVSSTTGYPAAPFLIGLERGTANEEVVLCTASTATTFTVTRGFDGTSAKQHAVGTSIEHTVSAIDYREATGPRTLRIPHTFMIPGDALVPSGDVSYIPPFFVPVIATVQTVSIVGARFRINSGTSATFSLRRNNGVGAIADLAAAYAGLVAGTADGAVNSSVALADGDKIAPVITAVAGTPRNVSITVYLDYTSVI